MFDLYLKKQATVFPHEPAITFSKSYETGKKKKLFDIETA